MSTPAATLGRLARPQSSERVPAELSGMLTARVLAFCALAFFAGARFASLLAHPPIARVLAIVVVAGACAAALSATRSLAWPAPPTLAFRALIVAASVFVAMAAAGASVHELWPWHWDRLARTISHGLGALDGRWPYDGGLTQTRVAVTLALPATIVPAAALAFWPGRGRGRAHAAALALLLLVYTTGAVNEPRTGWQVQGTLLLALLCAWGWTWRPHALDHTPAAASALAAAIAAILIASALSSSTPLLDYRAWNPFGTAYQPTSFDWNQTYRALAWPKSQETMVEVASRSPHLWRATTLDRFDGVRFLRSNAPHSEGPGTAVNPFFLERASFVLRGLRSRQLLSPGEALSASIAGTGLSHLAPIADDGTVALAGAPAASGDRYTITAYVPEPTTAELLASPPVFPAAYSSYVRFGLPAGARGRRATVTVTSADRGLIEASPYAGVFRLARSLAAGAGSTYAIVERVEGFLRRGFSYDESPPPSDYPLVSFLLSQRRGYCQQFSGAMTLLPRMDGVPARVAAGFLPGTRNRSTGLYRVSASDAHAWVEVYFAGIGWVPFDPTPPAPAAQNAASSSETGPGTGVHHPSVEGAFGHAGDARAARVISSHGAGAGIITPVLAVGLTLALLLVATLTLGTVRLRRAFAGDAAGAVRELHRAFVITRRPLAGGTTLAELERALGPRAGAYVRLLRERRYAGAPAGLPSTRERRLLRRALRTGRGPRARLRALIALPPGAMPPRRRGQGA